jgi:hypothetical protein
MKSISNIYFSQFIFLEQAERDATPLHQAARLLINSQLESGEFPQQVISSAAFLVQQFNLLICILRQL